MLSNCRQGSAAQSRFYQECWQQQSMRIYGSRGECQDACVAGSDTSEVEGLSVDLDHCKAVVQTSSNFQTRLPLQSLLSYLQSQVSHCILHA